MTKPELWTIAEAAEHIGAASNKSATSTLSRWGVKAVSYQRSPRGPAKALYSADEIRAAHANRPGRGTRTDRYPILAIIDGLGHRARWNDDHATVTTACRQTGTPTETDPTIRNGVPFDVCATCTRRGMQTEQEN
jgi:hypothetical protein